MHSGAKLCDKPHDGCCLVMVSVQDNGEMSVASRPLSSWIVDVATVSYALWTVSCHSVMLSGGSLDDLVVVTGVVAAAAGIVLWVLWRRARRAVAGAPAVTAVAPGPDDLLPGTRVLAGLAVVTIGSWYLLGSRLAFWFAAAAYVLVAAALALRAPTRGSPTPNGGRLREGILLVLACGSAFLALYGHRWRSDDCYYINLAVTLADHPELPLLSTHTIHLSPSGAPNRVFPPYRVHSFEALGGFISYLTGIEAIRVIHLGMASFGALLIPLAFAHLFRLLDGRRWLWMVAAAMCIHVFDGTAGLGFGNQGIVRMFTGKSVLLSAGLPILVANGIAFGLAPSVPRFLLLLAAQIAAVGLTSTALWLAPVAAMVAVAVPLSLHPRSLRTVGYALVSCFYVLALALWVRAQLMPSDDGGGSADAALAVADAESGARVGLVWWWLRKIFEEPLSAHAYIGLALLAIPMSRTVLARRYIVAFLSVITLLVLNPYLADFLRLNVFGRWTGQRGLWLAPVPATVAIFFTAFLPNVPHRAKQALGALVFAVGLGLFFWLVPTRPVFSSDNRVSMRWPPGPKVPPDAFELARALTETLPRDSQVLAPMAVSLFLPTLHHHPYPLLANTKYISASAKEKHRRKRLVERVTRRDDDFTEAERGALMTALRDYRIMAVVLTRAARKTPGMSTTLRRARFRKTELGAPRYRVWVPEELAEPR